MDRITAADAMELPAFAEFHDASDAPVCGPIDIAFLTAEHTAQEWGSMIFFEVADYKAQFVPV